MHNRRIRRTTESPAGSDNPAGHSRKEMGRVYHLRRLDLDRHADDERDPEGLDFVSNPHSEERW